MDNEILSPLTKEGFERDYLENLTFRKLLNLWLNFNNRVLKDNARQWFKFLLSDCLSKAKEPKKGAKGETTERTPEEIEERFKKIFSKKIRGKTNEK